MLTIEALPSTLVLLIALTMSLLCNMIANVPRYLLFLPPLVDLYDLVNLHQPAILVPGLRTDVQHIHSQVVVEIAKPQLAPYTLLRYT